MMDKNSERYDLVVAGSGPAGLAGAISAASSGARVILLEKESRSGGKIPISGGGRCNLTNVLDAEEMARSFGDQWRFLLPALRNFPSGKLRSFFDSRSVEIEVTDGFHCFPRSGKASHIVQALLDECDLLGVRRLNSCKVEEIIFDGGAIAGVRAGNRKISARSLLIASGGRSYPRYCGGTSGYELARQAGHRITPLFPAMTGVQCVEEWPKLCAGVSLPDVECRIDLPGVKERCRGELLFTHNGISAFAVLDLSGKAAELLTEHKVLPLKVNFFAGTSREEWLQRFQAWQQQHGTVNVSKLLADLMPRRLIPFLLEHDCCAARFTAAARRETAERLSAYTFHVDAVEGWEKAMVTRGGVDISEVFPRTLESRLCPGLFFAGEVLSPAGPCGGYNIQWAFSSGMLAGMSAARMRE